MRRPLVEQQNKGQFQVPDHGQHLRGGDRFQLHDALAGFEVQASPADFLQKGDRGKIGDEPRMAVGKPQNSAIFRDHAVDEMKVPGNFLQFAEDPAGHNQDGNSAGAHFGDGRPHFGVQDSVSSDRSIVVQRQHAKFHGRFPRKKLSTCVRK